MSHTPGGSRAPGFPREAVLASLEGASGGYADGCRAEVSLLPDVLSMHDVVATQMNNRMAERVVEAVPDGPDLRYRRRMYKVALLDRSRHFLELSCERPLDGVLRDVQALAATDDDAARWRAVFAMRDAGLLGSAATPESAAAVLQRHGREMAQALTRGSAELLLTTGVALALEIPSYARKFADAWSEESAASRANLFHVLVAGGHLTPEDVREEDEAVGNPRYDERAMLGILLDIPQKDWRKRNVRYVYLDGDDKRSMRIVTGYSGSTREALAHAFGDDDPSWPVVPGYADEPAWIS